MSERRLARAVLWRVCDFVMSRTGVARLTLPTFGKSDLTNFGQSDLTNFGSYHRRQLLSHAVAVSGSRHLGRLPSEAVTILESYHIKQLPC